jgi:hypothetical protein
MSGVAGQETPGSLASDYNTLAFAIEGLLAKLNTITVGRVISCSNTGGLSPWGVVTVQPLINQMSGTQQPTPHGQIAMEPYLRLQGGANAVIIDPQAGDIGILAFCSRDISGLKANPAAAVANGGVNPNGFAMFDWADGLYLGGLLNAVPTQYVRMLNGGAGIDLVSPTAITLTAPSISIAASASVTVNSPAITIEGGGTSIDGKVFLSHEHTGVQSGGSNTGGVA